MTSVRKAMALSFSSQYLILLVNFVSTIFIARLLTPAEVGIFSVGAAFVVLGHVLRDFGSGQYIVQEKELTDDRVRAAFTVTLGFGWLAGGLVFVLAPYAATFYQEPGVKDVLHLLALNFALLPFGSITMAYLQREMAFNKTIVVSVSGSLIHAVTSVSCAFAGLSYMSMVWGALAGTITTIVLATYFRPAHMPKYPGLREVRRVLSFSGSMSTSTLLGQLGRSAPELIIGKLQGTAGLGLFSRGRGIISLFEMLIMRGLQPVLMPLFAKKNRTGKSLASSYLHSISCLTALAWAFYGGLAVLAPEFILVVFGENWILAAPLVQIWCIAASVAMSVQSSGNLLVATGNINALLRRQIITLPISIILVFIGASISLEALAWMSIPGSVLWVGLILPKAMSIAQIKFRDYLAVLRRSATPAVASTATAYLVKLWLTQASPQSHILVLFAATIAGGTVWLVVTLITRHPLAEELDRMLNHIGARKRRS